MDIKIKATTQEKQRMPPIIRPKDIPDVDYELGCRVLFSSISLALKDPIARAQFEAWKKRRKQHET